MDLDVHRPTGLLLESAVCLRRLGNSLSRSSILGLICDMSLVLLSKVPERMEWAFHLQRNMNCIAVTEQFRNRWYTQGSPFWQYANPHFLTICMTSITSQEPALHNQICE